MLRSLTSLKVLSGGLEDLNCPPADFTGLFNTCLLAVTGLYFDREVEADVKIYKNPEGTKWELMEDKGTLKIYGAFDIKNASAPSFTDLYKTCITFTPHTEASKSSKYILVPPRFLRIVKETGYVHMDSVRALRNFKDTAELLKYDHCILAASKGDSIVYKEGEQPLVLEWTDASTGEIKDLQIPKGGTYEFTAPGMYMLSVFTDDEQDYLYGAYVEESLKSLAKFKISSNDNKDSINFEVPFKGFGLFNVTTGDTLESSVSKLATYCIVLLVLSCLAVASLVVVFLLSLNTFKRVKFGLKDNKPSNAALVP